MDKLTKEILDKDESLKKIHNKIDKIEDWNLLPNKPMVTVCMATYNHENYIREALDGVLMQKVNFYYEIIIKEDFSTDKTREIVTEYQKKYPDKIRLWLCKENLYSQKLKPQLDKFAKGKYNARCEGDDYWTDPLKLQKQVDFMERHRSYSLCFHAAKIVRAETPSNPSHNGHNLRQIECREYTGQEILSQWTIPTASVLFRRDCLNIEKIRNPNYLYGDITLFLSLAEEGRVWGMDEVMSVYRVHAGGMTSAPVTIEFLERVKRHYLQVAKDFPMFTGQKYFDKIIEVNVRLSKRYLVMGKFKSAAPCLGYLAKHPVAAIRGIKHSFSVRLDRRRIRR